VVVGLTAHTSLSNTAILCAGKRTSRTMPMSMTRARHSVASAGHSIPWCAREASITRSSSVVIDASCTCVKKGMHAEVICVDRCMDKTPHMRHTASGSLTQRWLPGSTCKVGAMGGQPTATAAVRA
jgi:hypothetical protein